MCSRDCSWGFRHIRPVSLQWGCTKGSCLVVALQETMRLYPAAGAASFRSNKTDKDIVLGGGKLVVPPGVILHMPITAVHHSEGTWENAYAFVPKRFLEERCRCPPPSCPHAPQNALLSCCGPCLLR
jgi:cytochrome P450